jgi:Asp/Glu/hydantoin racemase
VSIPVLKIDEAMMEHAAANFKKIGLAATNPGTVGPSTDLLKEKISRAGNNRRFETVLCDNAFDAFLSGDMKRHDEIVADVLQGLMKKVDVVVLAQASMARIADALPDKRVPVLSSPPFAMKRLAGL